MDPEMAAMSARDRVLVAYEDLLINDGPRAATLDAVASAAGVSKGGLLYHFKSKEAMTAGLADRLRALAAVDLEYMRADSQGCANYYVRTSVFGGTALDRVIIAAMRLAQGDDNTIRVAFSEIHANWFRLILEEIGDPAIARAVMLLGDGIYYHAALFGLPANSGDGPISSDSVDVDSLLAVVAQMRSGA